MEQWFRDVRLAFRTLRKNRSFAGIVILTLGLGIGVTTAIFTIFNAVLLEPLPYPDSDRLVLVYDTQPSCSTCPASFPKYHQWRERNRVFSAIGGSYRGSFTLTGSGVPERVNVSRTTASIADVLRINPHIGRWYTEHEDQPGGPKIIVINHDLWTERFNADPRAIGQSIILDGEAYEVIGVMPEGFVYQSADAYIPLQRELIPEEIGSHFLPVYARLADGVSVETATAEMRALGQSLMKEFDHNHGIDIRSYYEAIVGPIKTPLRVLLGATFILLAIAATNVMNLMLSSALERRHDLGIRLAMGAQRRDLVRQLLTESIVVAILGGIVGIAIAQGIVSAFTVLLIDYLPRSSNIAIDGRVLAFCGVVSVLVGVLCAILPVAVSTKHLATTLREGGTQSRVTSGRRVRSGLVILEIALSFVLLVGAGVLFKDLRLLSAREMGLNPHRIVAFDLSLPDARYPAPESVTAFYRQLYDELSSLATIETIGLTSHLPMDSWGQNSEFRIEGNAPWRDEDAPLVEHRIFQGDYFATLGIPLLAGRMLDERDGEGTQDVLINQVMADRFWPGQDPIGKRFGNEDDRALWHQVVGVVANARSTGLANETPYEFYRRLEQAPRSSMTVIIRTSAKDPTTVIPDVRSIVGSLDPELPMSSIQTMEDVVAGSLGRPRLLSWLSVVFALLAGSLAVVGVYGVVAYGVSRDRRDIGIRFAVGATERDILKWVLMRGLTLIAIGIAIGTFLAWILSRFLVSMVHDVQPFDSGVSIVIGIALVAVTFVASLVPARSAAHVQPIEVLREA